MATRRTIVATVLCALASGVAGLAATQRGEPAPNASSRALQWHELSPTEWDPTRRFRQMNLDTLSDNDPQARQLLLDMRATWDNAPTVAALDGAAVSLAGYVVPLEATPDTLAEFLLVPYFGACIHTPPPPANQIVLVKTVRPQAGLRAMDTVTVSGTLTTARQDSAMGRSGYTLIATGVERLAPPLP